MANIIGKPYHLSTGHKDNVKLAVAYVWIILLATDIFFLTKGLEVKFYLNILVQIVIEIKTNKINPTSIQWEIK